MKQALLVFLALPVLGEPLRLVPEGLPLRLTVYKTGLYSGRTHLIEFPRYSGTIEFDPAEPARSKVELAVELSEVRVLDTWVSDKDRTDIIRMALSERILDAKAHPMIRFRSTTVEAAGSTYLVHGELELRGRSNPVTLEVQTSREGEHLIVEGKTSFSVKPYGIRIPRGALGLIGTKDEMTLEFRVRAAP